MQPISLKPARSVEITAFIEQKDWKGRSYTLLNGVWTFTKRYSDTVLKIAICVSDVSFLIGQLSGKPTARMTKNSLIALNVLGILSWIYNVDWIKKDCQDAKFGYRMNSPMATILASINVAQSVRDFFLTVIGTIASVESITGHEDVQLKIYKEMRFVGFGAIIMGIMVYAGYFFATYLTSQKCQKKTEEEIQQIFRALRGIDKENDLFKGLYLWEPRLPWNPTMEKLAAEIRLCMDKDTLDKFLELLKQLSPEKKEVSISLFQIMQDNLNTQLKTTLGAKLILMILGSIVLGVERYYTPNSVVSAGINTVLSSAWAFQSIKEKYNESEQRVKAEKEVNNKSIVNSE